jgi:hypothetical protein
MPKAADQMAGKVPAAASAATAPKQSAPQKAAPPKQTAAPKATAPAPVKPAPAEIDTFEIPASVPEIEPSAPVDKYADMRPYLDAVGRIAELRRSQQIGAPLLPGAYGTTTPLASVQPMSRNPKGRAVPLSSIGPAMTTPIQRPSPEELNVPAKAAERAKVIDEAYDQAVKDYNAAELRISELERDPNFPRNEFPAMAREQRARLERVAALAASRREYGLPEK